MSEFKQYKRTNVAEMRPVTDDDVMFYNTFGYLENGSGNHISISEENIKNRSPKIGDMIARNPNNYSDQWLVAKEYFENNFEEL